MCWPTRTTSRNVGKRLPAPSTTDRSRPPAWGLGRRRGRGPGRCTAPQAASVFPPRQSPLRSSRCFRECYAQSAWPESHPVSAQKLSDMDRQGHPWVRARLSQRHRGPSRRRTPQDRRDPAGSDGGGSTAEGCTRRRRHLPAAPPAGCGQCSRGAGTTRSTSGWTVSSWRMADSAAVPSPAARASTILPWCPSAVSFGRSQPVTGPPET